MSDTLEHRLAKALEIIRRCHYLVAFTGAGISTESGIPDFRGPGGIWTRYRMVTYQEFITDENARKEYWRMKYELYRDFSRARPNRAHLALADLQRMGILKTIITQNIDGLHQDAGCPPETIIELHGNGRRAFCMGCQRQYGIEEVYEILPKSGFDPRCKDCGGLIKQAVVMFGEAMPQEAMMRALEEARRSDVMLMIGSSLQVEPAASVPRVAYQTGTVLIFINKTETPYDGMATLLFRESAGDVLTPIVERLREMP